MNVFNCPICKKDVYLNNQHALVHCDENELRKLSLQHKKWHFKTHKNISRLEVKINKKNEQIEDLQFLLKQKLRDLNILYTLH